MGTARFLLLYLLLATTGLYLLVRSDIPVPMNRPFDSFPMVTDRWRMTYQEEFDPETLKVLNATDYLARRYVSERGETVGLYIGYHAGVRERGEIHSPRQCLPGSGWFEASGRRTVVEAGSEKVNMAQAVYQKGDAKELFLYWFQVRGRTLDDEYSLKWSQITGSLLHRRRDAAFIRITVPVESSEEQAAAVGIQFIRDMYPLIVNHLPPSE